MIFAELDNEIKKVLIEGLNEPLVKNINIRDNEAIIDIDRDYYFHFDILTFERKKSEISKKILGFINNLTDIKYLVTIISI